ncbi:MAG: alanine racemase [Acidobacteriaceae bacterium]
MKSWIEISEKRLLENLRAVQALASDEEDAPSPRITQTLGVIKANAYGHDAAKVARILAKAGLGWLGVADVPEGVRVRKTLLRPTHSESGSASGATPFPMRILVMCGLEEEDYDLLVEQDLTPVVWTVAHLEMLERAAAASDKVVPAHLEIDSGMCRQGVDVAGVAEVARRLANSRWVQCEGVLSHLASAEVAGSEQTRRQQQRFEQALQVVVAEGNKPAWLHLAASSAVDEGGTLAWMRKLARSHGVGVLVRPGIALYGYCVPTTTGVLRPLLQPVLTWKTRVIGLRLLDAGESVGYGGTFTARSQMRLALLPVGYSDGFRRAASSGVGNGWVMIQGRRAAVVGRVSMNLTTVDVTQIEGVEVGSEVVLLGRGVTADDHAQWSGTISYEILCGIRARQR